MWVAEVMKKIRIRMKKKAALLLLIFFHLGALECLPKIELSELLEAYNPIFAPRANLINLMEYSQSEDYKRHAKTACIYYNSGQLTQEDALKIVFQREPTNIAMKADQYNKKNLEQLLGYTRGVYNDTEVKKKDGSLFKELPNTVAIYSETYLWNPPGGKNKKEIAALSLPAPALDSPDQPHYKWYMETGRLDENRYLKEIKFLFKAIERAIRDHKGSAFENKGIKRVVLSKFGQGAFLGALSSSDREIAQGVYKKELAIFLDRIKDIDLEVVMSEYFDSGVEAWYSKVVIGDIIKTAKEQDLIINAWDPHSAPGNGNDGDNSFDGAMGKGSGILLVQTSWLNETLRSEDSLVSIEYTEVD